jgi:glycosyltransferase involved in cell wall biosynthesis
MTEWPKISIITPSFNQGQYIEQTIQSVVNQGYPNLEYIVIDGGSTDETVDILNKYDSQIHYWVSEKDRGQSHAINKGLERASGDIINWLNSDDYYEPNSLFTVAKAFLANENIKAVLARTRVVGITPERYSTTEFNPSNPQQNFSKALIEQPATFFSGQFYRNVGPLNESLHLAMDLDLWIKFLLTQKSSSVKQLEDVVVNFREHLDSKTVNFRQKMVVERATLLREVIQKLDENKGLYASLVLHLTETESIAIKWGCTDFQMFWLKAFKKEQPILAKELKKLIHPKYLRFSDKLRRILC